MEDIFIAACRNERVLLAEIDKLAFGSPIEFSYENGEFCFIRHCKNKLLFGRDMFGRKSLCYRLQCDQGKSKFVLTLASTIDEEQSTSIISISTDSIDTGWRECYCGTFYVITLENQVVDVNKSSNVSFISYQLTIDSPSVGLMLELFSYYDEELVRIDQKILIDFFSQVNFTSLQTDLLKMTTEHFDDLPDQVIEQFTTKFIVEFEKAFQGLPIAHAKEIPVLFSGGVDSLMVAVVAGYSKPETPILLFNVAFGENVEQCSKAPDRLQAIEAFKFLSEMSKIKKCRCDQYKLVLVNVTKKELEDFRTKLIAKAIFPCNTVLDDSIGCVLWFASRTKGINFADDVEIKNDTPFAVVGSGSDEQFGGYARFNTVYKQKGIDGVAKLLHSELLGIGKRNLGRDDRVGTSNGKAILAPFLEENLVRFLNSVPAHMKTGFSINKENKFLLRNALKMLGVPKKLCQAPKKAMQFGSRFVGLEKRNEKGSDVCYRLIKH